MRLLIDGLRGDCTNGAGGSNFRAIFLRCNNQSQIRMRGLSLENYDSALRLYNFERALISDIDVKSGGSIVEYLASTGGQDSGVLVIDSIDAQGLTDIPIRLTPGTQTLDRLVLAGVRPSSSTTMNIITGYDPEYHLDLVADLDVQAFGSLKRTNLLPSSLGADIGDSSVTLTPSSPRYQRLATPLSQDRTISLPGAATAVQNGDFFEIVRELSASGTANLNIGSGPIASLAPGEGCRVQWDNTGAMWRLRAKWSLG